MAAEGAQMKKAIVHFFKTVTHMKFRNFLAAILSTTLLVACGGGGGGGSTTPAPVTSTDTFQLKTAWVNYFTNTGTHPFTVSGTSSGTSFTGSGTATNGSVSSATFESASALQKSSTITGTLSINGTSVPLSVTSTTYTDSNYNPLGMSGTEYEIVQQPSAIPATARVNDTGTWFISNRYSSSSNRTLLGTATVSFVLEPDTASTALLKIIRVHKNTNNATTVNSTVTFRMTPAGALTWLSESALDSTTSTTMTITYQ